MSAANPDFVTCRCNTCSGKIEFERASFDPKSSVMVRCPHCGIETLLYIPKDQATPSTAPMSKPEAMHPSARDESLKATGPQGRTIGRKSWLLIVLFGLIALLVVGVVYWCWTHSPNYALLQIESAIHQHDFEKFQEYVDIDSVATRAIDDLTLLTAKSDDGSSGGSVLGAGLFQLMKPRLVDEAKKQLNRFVESGRFSSGEALSEPLGNFNKNETEFLGVVSDRREGKIAIMGLGFTNHDERLAYVLELKMRKAKGHWQVAELSNLRELAEQNDNRLKDKAARATAHAKEVAISKISKMLRVVTASKESRDDPSAARRRIRPDEVYGRVAMKLTVLNTGDRDIEGFEAIMTPKDPEGQALGRERIVSTSLLRIGETRTEIWTRDIGDYNQSKEYVNFYRTPVPKIDVEFTRVKPVGLPEISTSGHVDTQ